MLYKRDFLAFKIYNMDTYWPQNEQTSRSNGALCSTNK